MKITHQLGLRGWVTTVRGKGGGMRLAQPPENINLGAVVRSIEPDFNLVECFGTSNTCVITGNCGLTSVLDGALQRFLAHLDGFALSDILPRSTGPTTASVRTVALHRMGTT